MHDCYKNKKTYLGLPKPRSNRKATKLTTHQNPKKCTICTWVDSLKNTHIEKYLQKKKREIKIVSSTYYNPHCLQSCE